MKQKEKKKTKVLPLLAGIAILVLGYARWIEPSSFIVKEYAIIEETLPSSFHGIKILQISDINYGTTTNKKTIETLQKTILELKPDLLVITGDTLNEKSPLTEEDTKDIYEFLNTIEAPLGTYLILGEQDKNLDTTKINAKVLNNETIELFNGAKESIALTGYNALNPDYTLIQPSLYKIALLHNPEAIYSISSSNLVLSGHTLGGTLWNQEESYKEIGHTKQYITNGLGTNKMKLRLFNKPSISLFRMYNH